MNAFWWRRLWTIMRNYILLLFLLSSNILHSQDRMFLGNGISDSIRILDFTFEPPRVVSFCVSENFHPESHINSTNGRLKLWAFDNMLYRSDTVIMDSLRIDKQRFSNNYYTLTPHVLLPTNDTNIIYSISIVTRFSTHWICKTRIDLTLNSLLGAVDTTELTVPFTSGKFDPYQIQTFPNSDSPFSYWIIAHRNDTFCSYLFENGKILDSAFSYSGKIVPYYRDKTGAKLNNTFVEGVKDNKFNYICVFKLDFLSGKIIVTDTVAKSDLQTPFPFESYSVSPLSQYVYYSKRETDSSTLKSTMRLYQYDQNLKKTLLVYEPDTAFRYDQILFATSPSQTLYVFHVKSNQTMMRYSVIKYPDRPYPYCKFEFNSPASAILPKPISYGFNFLTGSYPLNYDPTLTHKVSFGYVGHCDSISLTNFSDTSFYQKFIWYLQPDSMKNGLDSIIGFQASFTFKKNELKRWIKLKAISNTGFFSWFSDTVYRYEFVQSDFISDKVKDCENQQFNFIDLCKTDTQNYLKLKSWHWLFGDGTDTLISAQFGKKIDGNISHVYSDPGKFLVQLIFDNGYCIDTFTHSKEIEVLDAPKNGIDLMTDHCSPQVLQISDTVSNAASHYYQWGDGTDTTIHQAANINHYYPKSGTYILYQKLTGNSGCITSDSFVLKLFDAPNFSLGNDTFLCNGEQLILNIPNNNYKYNWNTGDTVSTLDIRHVGTYSVAVTNGLCVLEDSIKIMQGEVQFCEFNLITNPNPFRNSIWLTGYSRQPSSLILEIYDVSGRLVGKMPYSVNQNFSLELNTATLCHGLYVLRVGRGVEKPRIFKLIKIED